MRHQPIRGGGSGLSPLDRTPRREESIYENEPGKPTARIDRQREGGSPHHPGEVANGTTTAGFDDVTCQEAASFRDNEGPRLLHLPNASGRERDGEALQRTDQPNHLIARLEKRTPTVLTSLSLHERTTERKGRTIEGSASSLPEHLYVSYVVPRTHREHAITNLEVPQNSNKKAELPPYQ